MGRQPFYEQLPQYDDLEMQQKSVQSITITKETKPDGSIVRRKETLLMDGTRLVDEQFMSDFQKSLQQITSAFPPSLTLNKNNNATPNTTATNRLSKCYRILCVSTGLVLVLLLALQLGIWYLMWSPNNQTNSTGSELDMLSSLEDKMLLEDDDSMNWSSSSDVPEVPT